MNEPTIEPLAVSAAEAARLLGVSRPKVYELLNREGFPAFKLGGRTLISVEGLRRWVEQQAGGGEHG
jgi:excisionase family DNA binding protein